MTITMILSATILSNRYSYIKNDPHKTICINISGIVKTEEMILQFEEIIDNAKSQRGCLVSGMMGLTDDPTCITIYFEWDKRTIINDWDSIFLPNLLRISFLLGDFNFTISPKEPISTLSNGRAKAHIQKRRYFENDCYKPKLDDSLKISLLTKVKSYMEKEKPYLKSCTLYELSASVAIPPHYLSLVINEKCNQNFSDFVNSYRVAHVKKNLSREKLRNYTLMGIAKESGFNSRSTFYNAFKKITGISPGKYAQCGI